MNYLNLQRQTALTSSGLHQMTLRVPSTFNDVADLLSRGEEQEALRFPRSCGLPVVELAVLPQWRDLTDVPRTWA